MSLSQPLPPCRNETCPRYRHNEQMVIVKEGDADITFGCKVCLGIQVVTVNWRRGEQENDYQRFGRPEYARKRAYFDLGRGR